MNNRSLLGVTCRIKAADSFKHEEFGRQAFMRFKEGCAASDGGCNSGCADLYFSLVSRDLHEDRAATEVDLASSFIETENCVCTQTRDRKIGEGQLGARIHSRAHGGARADVIVHNCCPRRRLSGKQSHVVNYLSHARSS